MRILLLNPNTTEAITQRLLAAAVAVAAPGTQIIPLTAPRGVPYIASRVEAQIGGAIALEMLAGQHDKVWLRASRHGSSIGDGSKAPLAAQRGWARAGLDRRCHANRPPRTSSYRTRWSTEPRRHSGQAAGLSPDCAAAPSKSPR